jgi:hypothetical protein
MLRRNAVWMTIKVRKNNFYSVPVVLIITINVLGVYMAWDVMVLMRATSITRAEGRGGL